MPILSAIGVALIAVSAPSHSTGLPLERGAYVDVKTSCREAAMANHSWYSGSGYVITAPHAHCQAVQVRRFGKRVYEVDQTCRDEAMPKSDYMVLDRIQVLSPTEYVIHNNFGTFHARLCRETEGR
jgi:hypothetical protein